MWNVLLGMSELDQAAAKSRRTGKPALMRLNPLRNEVLETVHWVGVRMKTGRKKPLCRSASGI
jgi:hypothetical protein